MKRRVTITAALALLLTACGSATDRAPADPKAALAASTSGLIAGDYAFTVATPNTRFEGTVHRPSGTGELEITTGTRTEFRQAGSDHWLRMGLDPATVDQELEGIDLGDPRLKGFAAAVDQMKKLLNGTTWVHHDPGKFRNERRSPGLTGTDVTGAATLLSAVVAAQRDADRITGTLDMAGAGETLGAYNTAGLDALGTVPFTARLDGEGRLVHLELTLPRVDHTPAGPWTFDVTGCGAQQPVPAPAGAVEEMPDGVYALFSN